jgi:hypothetical protein
MDQDTLSALSRMAAVAAVVALILALWFVLTARGAADDSPASGEPDRAACLLGVDGATLKMNSVFLSELKKTRVEVRAIAPAAPRRGRSIGIPTRGASGVSCDVTEGVIGLRGGLKLVRGKKAFELRRWRLDASEGLIEVTPSHKSPVSISALTADFSKAERIMIGGNLSLRANLLLGEGGSAAIEEELGISLRPGIPVARLALAVREVSEETEAPDLGADGSTQR